MIDVYGIFAEENAPLAIGRNSKENDAGIVHVCVLDYIINLVKCVDSSI